MPIKIIAPVPTEDQVYLGGEKEKGEYVLKETGRIYVGNAKSPENIRGRRWNFGQVLQFTFMISTNLSLSSETPKHILDLFLLISLPGFQTEAGW